MLHRNTHTNYCQKRVLFALQTEEKLLFITITPAGPSAGILLAVILESAGVLSAEFLKRRQSLDAMVCD